MASLNWNSKVIISHHKSPGVMYTFKRQNKKAVTILRIEKGKEFHVLDTTPLIAEAHLESMVSKGWRVPLSK